MMNNLKYLMILKGSSVRTVLKKAIHGGSQSFVKS